jgi:uncharacterized SAM-binding protein YcdF (DUF218 family)
MVIFPWWDTGFGQGARISGQGFLGRLFGQTFWAGFLMSLFFIASKVLKIFLIPLWQFVLLIAAGQLAGWLKWRRLSRFFIGTAFTLFLLYSFLPFSQTLLRSLENYASAPGQERLAEAEGIIVLGGFTGSGVISKDRQAPQLSSSAERFVTALGLHKKYPEKPIYFTGFSGKLRPQGWSEDEVIERLLSDLHLPLSAFHFERQSRNTAQNAQFTYQMIRPDTDQKWILISSASHMMRADLSFHKAGWPPLILLPVDYNTSPNNTSPNRTETLFSPTIGFRIMKTVFHEYTGLLFYRLTGRL